jgi:uncharacterized membrane protein YdjX (TVP38/TMEM64 family)
MNLSMFIKALAAVAVVAVVASYAWWAPMAGLPADLPDAARLRQWFEGLGPLGPAAIVGAMVFAILVSPVPSAPIALTAGAIYGHVWGTLYVLAGAELGAVMAFAISRFLGYDLLHRWFGNRLHKGLAGSQNFLMGTVFVSRLLPFISFDIVSYAAGLTSLSFWRFAAATLAGIVPASFLLAHFGSELAGGETDRILIALVVLGLITAIPLLAKLTGKSEPD